MIMSLTVNTPARRFMGGQNNELENVAIANALQLQAARRRPVLFRFNFVAHAKFKDAQPIRCRLIAFSLLIRYVTL